MSGIPFDNRSEQPRRGSGAGRTAERTAERKIVLVSGPPAAGKTTLATTVAAELGWPLISKDDIKEALVDALMEAPTEPSDGLDWSRRAGGAAMAVLWRLARRCPRAVLEANFRSRSALERERLHSLEATIVELHCACPPDELVRRFAERARTAHPAHPQRALTTELIAECSRPMAMGHVIDVDTAHPVDVPELMQQLAALGVA